MNTRDNTTNAQCSIYRIVCHFFNKIGWKIVQKTCEHKNKFTTWTDYPDRYHEEYCPDCNLITYEGMD